MPPALDGIPLSALRSRVRLGGWLRRRRLIPVERDEGSVAAAHDGLAQRLNAVIWKDVVSLGQMASSSILTLT